MADDVQLPDLEVIRRYSLAVRSGTAPRDELIAALEADLAWLTGAGGGTARRRAVRPRAEATAPARTAAVRRARKA